MARRLQIILAERLGISRRKGEDMIDQGRVSVNGIPAVLGMSCEDDADILLDGHALPEAEKHVYIALYKPLGYVTTMSDQFGRPDVSELLRDVPCRVYPCGRLDMYSEGLLICTNDGQTANRVTHPSHEIEKEYLLKIKTDKSGAEAVSALTAPMSMDGRPLAPVKCRLLSEDDGVKILLITIREGRNRQIRRMCETCGFSVRSLKRVAEGKIKLGELKSGKWRYLTSEEIRYLKGIKGRRGK